MKKSLLALAALGAFAGAAFAQSSVTMYGLIDANVGKDIGSAAKRMGQGASSRLGWRGVEDLGGGMQAFFQLENRFTPWNGMTNGGAGTSNGSQDTQFQARSYVGLRGGWGEVRLGREYNGSFFHSELFGDAWGWDTVAFTIFGAIQRSPVPQGTNVNSAITYNSPNMGGFTFTAQIAESNGNCGAKTQASPGAAITLGTCAERPKAFGASYAAGPFTIRAGIDNPGNKNDSWTTFSTTYDFGAFKLWGFMGNGKDTTAAKHKAYTLQATMPLGAGEFRVGMSKRSVGGVTNVSGLGLAYFYSLSKRTTLYTDFARNGKAATEKSGYDFGVRHTF
jgi:predicted porin